MLQVEEIMEGLFFMILGYCNFNPEYFRAPTMLLFFIHPDDPLEQQSREDSIN